MRSHLQQLANRLSKAVGMIQPATAHEAAEARRVEVAKKAADTLNEANIKANARKAGFFWRSISPRT